MKDEKDKSLGLLSNAIRLSGREALFGFALLIAFFYLIPKSYQRVEPFDPGRDYRMPYELSNDYWLYGRYASLASSRYKTLVIGDSVVWGQYVRNDQTLPHYLNVLAKDDLAFANLGLDGSHPLALEGLIQYYGGAITGKRVLLHYNPLWVTSEKHDLRTDKEFQFNHPRLVPQFAPWIPCYTGTYADRIGIVMERHLTLFGWANHVRLAYFDKMNLPNWTMEHPYRNPLGAITLRLPPASIDSEHQPLPWTARGIDKSDFPWVELVTSLQWGAFERLVELLLARGNKVFVVVGPFNEHMLLGKSAATYAQMKREMESWLTSKSVPSFIPPALPSELYADASHPLSAGYELLAKQFYANEDFARFDGR
jgi:hypothetical protein